MPLPPPETPIEELSAAVLDTVSAQIDWRPEGVEALDSDSEPQWWDSTITNHTGWDGVEHTVTIISDRFGATVAVFLADGTRINNDVLDDPSDYIAEHSDEDDSPLPGTLSEADLDALFAMEFEVEGPMMSYWYSLQTTSSPYGASVVAHGGDQIDAAYRLHRTSLCVVEVDGTYGLALTGGGMDLTWDIVRAFASLGYLPPVAFCRPPGFFQTDTDYLLAAMRRAVEVRQQQLGRMVDEIDRQQTLWTTELLTAAMRRVYSAAGGTDEDAYAKAMRDALRLAVERLGVTLPEDLRA